MIIKNAIIESTSIDMGGRGLLQAWLHLDYGDCSHQGFGGHILYLPKDFKNCTCKGDFAGHFIFRCLQITGVESWKEVSGKAIRVKLDKEGLSGRIIGIGHITKDDWFFPEEDFKNMSI